MQLQKQTVNDSISVTPDVAACVCHRQCRCYNPPVTHKKQTLTAPAMIRPCSLSCCTASLAQPGSVLKRSLMTSQWISTTEMLTCSAQPLKKSTSWQLVCFRMLTACC